MAPAIAKPSTQDFADPSSLLKTYREDCHKARKLYFLGVGDVGEGVDTAVGKKKLEKLREVEDHLKAAESAYTTFMSTGDSKKLQEALTNSRQARFKATMAIGLPPHRRTAEIALASSVATLLVIGAIYVLSHVYTWTQTGQIGLWTGGTGFWIEVGMWATFGACSYGIMSILRHLKDFDRDLRLWFLGYLFWAPLLAIPTIFLLVHVGFGITATPGTNATADPVTVALWQAPAEVLMAVAFLLGLFSRRTYFLLRSFRDKLLPEPAEESKERVKK